MPPSWCRSCRNQASFFERGVHQVKIRDSFDAVTGDMSDLDNFHVRSQGGSNV